MNVVKLENCWERVGNQLSLLGEGPIWDAEKGQVMWVDILNGDIHTYNPESGKQTSLNLGQKVSAVALQSNNRVIAGLKEGIATVDMISGKIEFVAKPESQLPDNRCNDGKCDPAGRFWIGTMSEVPGSRNTGALYVVEHDYTVLEKITGVSCSNGLAWNLEQNTFYFIDTPTRQVVAYDYHLDSGAIGNPRVVVSIPEDQGVPDGMTIDTEGMLWIAHWNGWKVSRWNPSTGEQLLDLVLPVARITSCAFGGTELQDLYITSACVGLTDAEMKDQKWAGSLFVVKNIGAKGVPASPFIEQASPDKAFKAFGVI